MGCEKMAEENLHANHRARMQERVDRDGLDSLAEHEALEYLLFLSIPRADTNELTTPADRCRICASPRVCPTA